MGQSQLLIIAISVLIIGIAIAAGAGFFSNDETEANKRAMVNDINHIAMNAARYYRRIPALGGGGYSFAGYVLPPGYRANLNGTYFASVQSRDVLEIRGVSKGDTSSTMTAQVDKFGKASNWTFTGDF